MIKKILKIILFIILINLTLPCFGQDVSVNGRNTNLYFDGTSLPWSSLASRNYIIAPIGPDFGFCISIVNNNTTSSHSFSVSAFQSGDFNVGDYSHNTGRYAPLTIVGTPSPIAANATGTFFVKSNGASKVAFSFSGGSTQAGSPDTFDIYGVQTTANGCGTVNPSTGQSYNLSTSNTGTSSSTPLMAVSDGISQAFITSQSQLNPASGLDIIEMTANSGVRTIYFDKLSILCTASCTVSFNLINSNGTGGSTNTPQNQKISSSVTSTSIVRISATTPGNPVFFVLPNVVLAANTLFTYDLKGFIAPAGTNTGIQVQMGAALTGNITVTYDWYEK